MKLLKNNLRGKHPVSVLLETEESSTNPLTVDFKLLSSFVILQVLPLVNYWTSMNKGAVYSQLD